MKSYNIEFLSKDEQYKLTYKFSHITIDEEKVLGDYIFTYTFKVKETDNGSFKCICRYNKDKVWIKTVWYTDLLDKDTIDDLVGDLDIRVHEDNMDVVSNEFTTEGMYDYCE